MKSYIISSWFNFWLNHWSNLEKSFFKILLYLYSVFVFLKVYMNYPLKWTGRGIMNPSPFSAVLRLYVYHKWRASFNAGILDLALNFPGFHRWKFTDVLRNILKVIVSLGWAVALPLCYLHTFKMASEKFRDVLSFLNPLRGIPPLYIMAVALYLLPNLLAAVLFIFPMLRRWIENSNWHIIRFLLWWSQVDMLLNFLSLCFSSSILLSLSAPSIKYILITSRFWCKFIP